ncbi:MBL fold metallo-hydrolase [Roseovarius faecimaris]|uniref:MBL fold metallo-hydrolase n=1 Tax=Roseovarius faecimaris TaxID=2494550 RepID=A0A6I6IMC0_9RHOB|nr:MBL fold metallo-hydrolase [Roseovarius faecimaris]QGX96933.1 MBL fold metallo-hydrolase [Roseovarius faecimaris]
MQESLEVPIEAVTLAPGVALAQNWFALRALDDASLAIGEPAYHQCNWSYLLSDCEESLLWDTGSGRRSIAPVVARYGQPRVTAFPSHMHFDHLGGIGDFETVMLADLPILRALEADGVVSPPERMFLGAYEGLTAPRFSVTRWIGPGETLEVGARRFSIVHTPGHSPDSVSLWEAERGRLYAADLLYCGELYAQTPGASLQAYAATLRDLLAWLPKDVEILGAHGQQGPDGHDAPRLSYGDAQDALSVIEAIIAAGPHDGERRINSRMTVSYAAPSFSG